MGRIVIFFITLISNVIFAQYCLPFNIDILQKYSKTADSIKPIQQEDGFRFININSGENAYPLAYQEAYPFYNDVAIVKYNNLYNLINRKGEFIIKKEIPDFIGRPTISLSQSKLLWFGNFHIHVYDSLKNPWNFEQDILSANRSFTIYKSDNNKYGFTCRDRFEELKFSPKYDSILSISESFVLAKLHNKIGLEDLASRIIIPYKYDKAIPLNLAVSQNFFAFRKNGKWHYFDRFGTLILVTKIKVDRIANNSDEIIGFVKNHGKLDILYKDGSLSNFKLDSISENGNIGFRENEVLLINDNKTVSKYFTYSENRKISKISIRTQSPYGDWVNVDMDENYIEIKKSSGQKIKKQIDKNIWKSLIVHFNFCDYLGLKESGNRTHVDGSDVIVRVYTEGMCFPKYTPQFYPSTEKMQQFNTILERYLSENI